MNVKMDTLTPLEVRMRGTAIRLEDIAGTMGISVHALINKKKGKAPFSVSEMMSLARILQLNAEETLMLFCPGMTKADKERLFGGAQ